MCNMFEIGGLWVVKLEKKSVCIWCFVLEFV